MAAADLKHQLMSGLEATERGWPSRVRAEGSGAFYQIEAVTRIARRNASDQPALVATTQKVGGYVSKYRPDDLGDPRDACGGYPLARDYLVRVRDTNGNGGLNSFRQVNEDRRPGVAGIRVRSE